MQLIITFTVITRVVRSSEELSDRVPNVINSDNQDFHCANYQTLPNESISVFSTRPSNTADLAVKFVGEKSTGLARIDRRGIKNGGDRRDDEIRYLEDNFYRENTFPM